MLHTYPDASEIVVAVREFLEHDVMPATEPGLSFHARVAANLLRTLERELALGPGGEERFQHRLAELGAADEEDLARRIRTRDLDPADERLLDALRTITGDRLAVANPKYLSDEVDDDPRSAGR
ncbi:DUF6285 domain-containing protein [Nocardioides pacificus]